MINYGNMKKILIVLLVFVACAACKREYPKPVFTLAGYGYQDSKGNWTLNPVYPDAQEFSDGYAAVTMGGYWGYIDVKGRKAFETNNFTFTSASPFYDGLAAITITGGPGIIDKKGNFVVPVGEYELIWNTFDSGMILVNEGGMFNSGGDQFGVPDIIYGKSGYLDRKGNVVVPLEYLYATAFSCGLAGVGDDTSWGYIDKKGEFVIPRIYRMGGRFVNDIAIVVKDNKYGYINTKGEEIIPIIYDSAEQFGEDGTARVTLERAQFYIDKQGNTVEK